jgi:competence protein ComEA
MNWENLQNKQKIIFVCIIASLLIFFVIAYLNYIGKTRNEEDISIKFTNSSDNQSISSNNRADTYFVEITGYVNYPGVYEIFDETMIIELINYAGGFTEDADVLYLHKNLNLSSYVSKQTKIYIPSKGESNNSSNLISANASSSLQTKKISINNATLEELTTLKGVGPATASKIIENRPYNTLEDLLKVSGIGQTTYNNLITYISL